MSKEHPFNAHSFLTKRVALSAFHFESLVDEIAAAHAGAYYTPENSPYSLFPPLKPDERPLANEQALHNLHRFILGIRDGIALQLLQKPSIRDQYVHSKDYFDDPEYQSRNQHACDHLKPKLLLDWLDYDWQGLNAHINEIYSYNFDQVAGSVNVLLETLKDMELQHILGKPRGKSNVLQVHTIVNGPQLLRDIKQIHKVIEHHLHNDNLDSAVNYPEQAKKTDLALDGIIEDLQDEIDRAHSEQSRNLVRR